MSDDFVTRDEADPLLQDTMRLCGKLAVVRHGLRVQVNNLDKTVEERRETFERLKADEEAIIAEIDKASIRLTPANARWMQQQVEEL